MLKHLVEFNNKSKPKNKEGKDKKRDTYESVYGLQEGWQLTLNTFKSGIFPLKTITGKRLKVLTFKQMP